ncbi:hypothetical protein pEaSNUABM6_00143 [Erwinia phage pEa_SNUABM_6]|nr:hypothetical protein pEaSNUABM6_00143 [Erwinia phage pEa_SNUABM_6]
MQNQFIRVPLFSRFTVSDTFMIQNLIETTNKLYALAKEKFPQIEGYSVPEETRTYVLMEKYVRPAYRALTKLDADSEEALKIIALLHDVYCGIVADDCVHVEPTPAMLLGITNQNLESQMYMKELLENKPGMFRSNNARTPRVNGITKKDITLIGTTDMPDDMCRAILETMSRFNMGRNTLLAGNKRNVITAPTSFNLNYLGDAKWEVDIHVVGQSVPDLVWDLIIERLKAGSESTEDKYTVDGDKMIIELAQMVPRHNLSDTVIHLVTNGMKNTIVHTLLDISKDRYHNEIVLRPLNK